MLGNRDRVLEEVHDRSEGSSESPREQDAQEGRRLRAASEVIALVSASVLVGGGIGVLGGVALEAINPFALGMVGVVVGICLPLLIRSVIGAWWRRTFGS